MQINGLRLAISLLLLVVMIEAVKKEGCCDKSGCPFRKSAPKQVESTSQESVAAEKTEAKTQEAGSDGNSTNSLAFSAAILCVVGAATLATI